MFGQTRGMGELVDVAGKVTDLAPVRQQLAELGDDAAGDRRA